MCATFVLAVSERCPFGGALARYIVGDANETIYVIRSDRSISILPDAGLLDVV
jgi:hypothetical protein